MEMARQEAPTTMPPERLAALFESHSRGVLGAAYRVTGNRQDAEDALQTVFLRLSRGGNEEELSDTPGSYLRRAAVNAAIDLLRARSRASSIPLDEIGELVDRSEASPERRHRDREFRLRLRRALLVLSDRYAEIFALRYFEGLTNLEIARLLKVSQTRIAVTLHRARKRLQSELRDQIRGEA